MPIRGNVVKRGKDTWVLLGTMMNTLSVRVALSLFIASGKA